MTTLFNDYILICVLLLYGTTMDYNKAYIYLSIILLQLNLKAFIKI